MGPIELRKSGTRARNNDPGKSVQRSTTIRGPLALDDANLCPRGLRPRSPARACRVQRYLRFAGSAVNHSTPLSYAPSCARPCARAFPQFSGPAASFGEFLRARGEMAAMRVCVLKMFRIFDADFETIFLETRHFIICWKCTLYIMYIGC